MGLRRLVTTHMRQGPRFWETSFSLNACFSVYFLRFNNFSKPLGGSNPYQARLCSRFGGVLWDLRSRVWEFRVVDMGLR